MFLSNLCTFVSSWTSVKLKSSQIQFVAKIQNKLKSGFGKVKDDILDARLHSVGYDGDQ